MGGMRRIVGFPSGRRTKWVVLGFWIVVFAIAGPLSAKLNSAQQNDLRLVAQQRRVDPGGRAGQAVRAQRRVPGAGRLRAPRRPVTAADQAKATADAQRFAGIQDVTGKVLGPIPSEDGQALQVVVPIKVAEEGNGWEEPPHGVDEMRSIAQADTGGLNVYVTGPAGYFADFSEVFSGFDPHPVHHRGDRDRHLVADLPQPGAVATPLTTVFVALTAAQAVIYLLARDAGLTVNAQTAFILTVLVFVPAPTMRCC